MSYRTVAAAYVLLCMLLCPPNARAQNEPVQSVVSWAGCLSAGTATVARVDPSTIRFCGRITDQSLARFRSLLTPDVRLLQIASLGGELDAPLAFADLVRRARLDVEVISLCFSGCASYVFVAGMERRVRPGAVLALHNTYSSLAVITHELYGGREPQMDAPLRVRAMREQMLYREIGVSQDLLFEPQARIRTTCVSREGRNARTGETEYLYFAQFSFWVPTAEQWRANGVVIQGFLPDSAQQAQALATERVPRPARSGLRLLFSSDSVTEAPIDQLSGVRWCSGRPVDERTQ